MHIKIKSYIVTFSIKHPTGPGLVEEIMKREIGDVIKAISFETGSDGVSLFTIQTEEPTSVDQYLQKNMKRILENTKSDFMKSLDALSKERLKHKV